MGFPTIFAALLGLLGFVIFAGFVCLMVSVWCDLMHEGFYTLCTFTAASQYRRQPTIACIAGEQSASEDDDCWMLIPVLVVLVLASLAVPILVVPALLMKTACWVVAKVCRWWFWPMRKVQVGLAWKALGDVEKGE